MKEIEIERLFRQHYDRMIRLARTMLYDDEESRDVVSEVFATLVKTDIMPKNVESYLITSVKNRCLNLLEHKEVRARFEQAYTAEKNFNSSNQEPLTYGETEPAYAERWERLMEYAGATDGVCQTKHDRSDANGFPNATPERHEVSGYC